MITIIVPVYKVERYLRKCVRSILSQDYRDIEVILVNDASPDGSLAICNEFAARDARVRVIDKPVNEGVDLARYSGLDAVSPRSEYVMFVDSDDWLSPGILTRCHSVAEETGADFVQMRARNVYDRFGLIARKMFGAEAPVAEGFDLKKIDGDEFRYYFSSFFGNKTLSVEMWGKLYRRDLFVRAEPKPSSIKWGQDLVMNMWLFPFVRSFANIGDMGYNYRTGGITSHPIPGLLKFGMQRFELQKEAALKYGYEGGLYSARVWMRNLFKEAIEQRIAFRYGSREENISEFAALLKDPVWDDILCGLCAEKQYGDDRFMQLLASRDVAAIYDMCASYTIPHGLKRKIQKSILKLLN